MRNVSSKLKYLSQFPVFLHQRINDIVDVGDDGTCGFQVIAALLGWGEESRPLIQTQLYTEFYQHHQLYFNLLYDTMT